jgi:ketosteroid isomerase-like protein
MSDYVQLAKDYYAAFSEGDREHLEALLASNLLFSAPPDPRLDRAGYFERCWPGAGKGQAYTFVRLKQFDNEVLVTYEQRLGDNPASRNTEILTFEDSRIKQIEVYFGWEV